jgi:AP2 domain
MTTGKTVVASKRGKFNPWHSQFRIYRNEHGGCQGWQALVSLNARRHTRYFPDRDYGSADLSLRAAQDFAHRDIELHLEYLALRRRLQPRANSRSGIPGVARFSDRKRGDFWAAYYDDREGGVRKMKRFSVAQFGEEQARELAIEFRTESMEPFRRRLEELESLLSHSACKGT